MKEIKLSQQSKKNKGKFVTLVDDEDYEYLNQWRWCAHTDQNTYYVSRNSKYINGKRKEIRMHRVIMNTPKDMEVDHVFHNGLDNRKFIEIDGELKQNLRNCTRTQNNMNRTASGRSKYLGVNFDKSNNKWKAQIRINAKKKSLGYFKSEIDAARKYDEMAKIHHGEYANLNFK